MGDQFQGTSSGRPDKSFQLYLNQYFTMFMFPSHQQSCNLPRIAVELAPGCLPGTAHVLRVSRPPLGLKVKASPKPSQMEVGRRRETTVSCYHNGGTGDGVSEGSSSIILQVLLWDVHRVKKQT